MRKLERIPLALSSAFMALAFASVATAQQAPASPPPRVGVVQAHAMKMAPKVVLPGTVVARNDSHLASEVEGRVAWVAEVGTIVKAGDVVARIDKNVAGMQLTSDKANVARSAAQLNFDRSQAERMDRLFQQSAIAKATRDQASSTRDMDEAALRQAQASLLKSKYQYDHSEIRAPFPGRVVARLINTGEYAAPGKEIVRLVQTDSIEVKAQAPIDTAHFLREGMPVTVEIAKRPIVATVRAIVPVGDELSRTIEVRVTLKPGQAYVGDAAKVLAPSAAPRDVLAVPRDALVLREDNTYIFKVDGKNRATRVAVETGSADGSMVEVHGPVKAGDRVIVRGAERLEAGQVVLPILAS
jgi:RND family efflux transporter MFP subunit